MGTSTLDAELGKPLALPRKAARRAIPGLPAPMSLLLAASDLAAVVLAWVVAIAVRTLWGDGFMAISYLDLTPVALIFPAAYALSDLYPAVAFSPAVEIRRLTAVTSFAFLALGGIVSFARPIPQYSRFIIGLSWMLSLLAVPLARSLCRAVLGRFRWWGEKAAVIIIGHPALDLSAHLEQNRWIGLRPVLKFQLKAADLVAPACDEGSALGEIVHAAEAQGVRRAFIVTDEALAEAALTLETCRDVFEKVVLVDIRPFVQQPWTASLDLGGICGLEIRHNLLNPWAQVVKRGIDIVGATIGILVLLPALTIVGMAIRIDSPGPVFYRQRRVGKRGSHFDMLKLRTMHADAHTGLEYHLASDPELRREWNTYQKLRNDPRVTRVGHWLRKYSLDEFPQLWNVLRGEMSLVGPRPYFPEQQDAYGKGYESYIRVPPGITGMWQVSGRSRESFATRVKLDEYYVRNWSVFLDIYLLARTVRAVGGRDGAY